MRVSQSFVGIVLVVAAYLGLSGELATRLLAQTTTEETWPCCIGSEIVKCGDLAESYPGECRSTDSGCVDPECTLGTAFDCVDPAKCESQLQQGTCDLVNSITEVFKWQYECPSGSASDCICVPRQLMPPVSANIQHQECALGTTHCM